MSEFIRTQLIRVPKRLSWLFPDRLYLQLFYRLAMNSWPRLDPNKTTLFEQLLGEKIDLSLCDAIPYQ